MRRKHHATVVSYIALFVALGGTSLAAYSLGRHSVKNRHLATGAVTGRVVRDGSLSPAVFAGDVRIMSLKDAQALVGKAETPRAHLSAAGLYFVWRDGDVRYGYRAESTASCHNGEIVLEGRLNTNRSQQQTLAVDRTTNTAKANNGTGAGDTTWIQAAAGCIGAR